jgi:hypothetical protein
MKRLPGDIRKDALQPLEPHELEHAQRMPAISSWPGPFFSFSYTSQVWHAEGGKASVTAEQVRFENGRLSREHFEGQLPMEAYHQAVADAQQMFAGQTLSFLEQCSALLSLLLQHPDRKR